MFSFFVIGISPSEHSCHRTRARMTGEGIGSDLRDPLAGGRRHYESLIVSSLGVVIAVIRIAVSGIQTERTDPETWKRLSVGRYSPVSTG